MISGCLDGKLPIQRNSYDVKRGKSPYYYLDGNGNEIDHPVEENNQFTPLNNMQGKAMRCLYDYRNVGQFNEGVDVDNKESNEAEKQKLRNLHEKLVRPLYNDCREDERYENYLQRLKSAGYEGRGYEDNLHRIEQPTHTGISQKTLGNIFKKYPAMELAYRPDEGATLNDTLQNLTQDQIDNIYCQEYYKPYRVNEIKDNRIAYANFDTHVMSGPDSVARTFQKSLNEMGYPVTQDGIFGSQTINALNRVSADNKTDEFMEEHFKPNRMKYLRSQKDADKYRGWFSRTRRY